MMTADKESALQTNHQVPGKKQTTLGLYVTAKEAYAMWEGEPESIHVIDVRTPEEYVFVGHPEMAVNIPVGYVEQKWDSKENDFVLVPNADFVASVNNRYSPSDTLLVMCRSGNRSAFAANLLAKAGFSKVYNIIDGMEGDKVDDPGSDYHGKRMQDGWKNSGAPWTYDVNLDLLRIPAT